eukprot:scaffold72954_cov51-Attheya_sp.AAC.1
MRVKISFRNALDRAIWHALEDLLQEDIPEDSQEDIPEDSSNDEEEDEDPQELLENDNMSQTETSQSNTTGTTHVNMDPWNTGPTFTQESTSSTVASVNTSLHEESRQPQEKLTYNQIVSQFQTLA